MNARYTVSIDPELGLLRIALGGFFSVADVEAIEVAKKAALVRLGLPRNAHLTLIDVSECMLQAQEVFAAFQAAVGNPRYMAHRLALVTGDSPIRMQARRLLTRDNTAFFATAEEAEAWLFDTVPMKRAVGA